MSIPAGLLPNPLLRTLEQSGKAIPSARQLDPLTRSHVSPRSYSKCESVMDMVLSVVIRKRMYE